MNKDKLNWCLKQKNGIKLIEMNENLSRSYILEADETLTEMLKLVGKWKTITGYYACYNALYSILIKCGIKCEIHICSIELMKLFEFNDEEINFLSKLKDDRIQAQYYLKDKKLNDEDKVKEFIVKCKLILNKLNTQKITEIRNKLK